MGREDYLSWDSWGSCVRIPREDMIDFMRNADNKRYSTCSSGRSDCPASLQSTDVSALALKVS